MANITISSIYDQISGTFKVGGTNRFDRDFLNALNSATARVNREAALTTRISRVTSREGSIALSDDYWDVVVAGVTVEMVKLGNRPQADMEGFVQQAEDRFMALVHSLWTDLVNQRQAADPDDESDDIIGHGHLS
jgi:hypothetical protein